MPEIVMLTLRGLNSQAPMTWLSNMPIPESTAWANLTIHVDN
jgi:hypothetical protein